MVSLVVGMDGYIIIKKKLDASLYLYSHFPMNFYNKIIVLSLKIQDNIVFFTEAIIKFNRDK